MISMQQFVGSPRVAAAVAAILGVQAATAQELPSSSNGGATDALGEITVTAQRRTENIQDVPITIQALTAETLTQLNVQTFDDVIKFLPNVTSNNNGPGQSQLIIRGLATSESGNQGEGATAPF